MRTDRAHGGVYGIMPSRARRPRPAQSRSRRPRRAGWPCSSASSTSPRACGICPTRPSPSSSRTAGCQPGQVADFFLITTIPWLIKPVYGLLSDFVPLFGRRRKSYFLLDHGAAAAARASPSPLTAASIPTGRPRSSSRSWASGLAFTDVLTDALMVENGRPLGLTGAFQAVQWAAIYTASMLVGVGGRLPGGAPRRLDLAFALAACFPARLADHGAALRARGAARGRTWAALRASRAAPSARRARHREVWIVAGFIFFFNFSPSFGPAFLYYQTDVLRFSQEFIGMLPRSARWAPSLGAIIYAPLSRRYPLRPHHRRGPSASAWPARSPISAIGGPPRR